MRIHTSGLRGNIFQYRLKYRHRYEISYFLHTPDMRSSSGKWEYESRNYTKMASRLSTVCCSCDSGSDSAFAPDKSTWRVARNLVLLSRNALIILHSTEQGLMILDSTYQSTNAAKREKDIRKI